MVDVIVEQVSIAGNFRGVKIRSTRKRWFCLHSKRTLYAWKEINSLLYMPSSRTRPREGNRSAPYRSRATKANASSWSAPPAKITGPPALPPTTALSMWVSSVSSQENQMHGTWYREAKLLLTFIYSMWIKSYSWTSIIQPIISILDYLDEIFAQI